MRTAIALFILSTFFSDCNNGRLCKCDNGVQYKCRTEEIYNDNQKMIKTNELKIKNSIDVLGRVTDSTSVSATQRAEALVTKLNELHTFYVEILNQYTRLITTFPCNEVYQNKYIAVLDNFSNLNSSLQNIATTQDTTQFKKVESVITNATISQANIGIAKKGSADTTKLDASRKTYLSKVNSLLGRNTFWVYYGQLSSNKTQWLTKNFITSNTSIPQPGNEIVPSIDITRRDAAPVGSGNNWTLGNVIGYLNRNTPVTVLEVKEIEDQNIWMRVKL